MDFGLRELEQVSILGLARSPTMPVLGRCALCTFQYLGSRGAQLDLMRNFTTLKSFNTWAREEPNRYTGWQSMPCTSFNTWAREEPNYILWSIKACRNVSILGLARSPTAIHAKNNHAGMFQYLGSRGAQQRGSGQHNVLAQFQYLGSRGAQLVPLVRTISQSSVSILGLARSPTITRRSKSTVL